MSAPRHAVLGAAPNDPTTAYRYSEAWDATLKGPDERLTEAPSQLELFLT